VPDRPRSQDRHPFKPESSTCSASIPDGLAEEVQVVSVETTQSHVLKARMAGLAVRHLADDLAVRDRCRWQLVASAQPSRVDTAA
jgi:hypothetical protein